MPTLVHLVYIHGFQGNDTTFQSFPKHLQEHISSRVPSHLDITFRTSLYPTYESVKPLSYATKNFLEWLTTQPPGPVILMGHSMGGLLAAEAATDRSNNPGHGSKPKRIIGVVAFDTPYLGMHPHVVISGIASLLPKGDKEDPQQSKSDSEGALNDHPQVTMVDERVTDDWEAFKKQSQFEARTGTPSVLSENSSDRWHDAQSHRSWATAEPSLSLNSHSMDSSHTSTPAPPSAFVDRALTFVASINEDPRVRWIRKHADDPFTAGKRWIVERCQFGGSMFDPQGLKSRYSNLVDWQGGRWVNYWTETVPRQGSTVPEAEAASEVDNDAALVATGIVHPVDEASSAKSDEQHGSTGSTQETVPVGEAEAVDTQEDNTKAQPTPPEASSSTTPDHHNSTESIQPIVLTAPTKEEAKATEKKEAQERKEAEKARKAEEKARKQEEKTKKEEEKKAAKKKKDEEKQRLNAIKKAKKENAPKPARHFIVLPNGLGGYLGGWDRWERVPIEGVEDEVNAHLGLFIPEHNLDYLGLISRVATKILGWCEELPDVVSGPHK